MPILVTATGLTKSFTARPLFEGLSFVIESGDRIGLIGPNGAGKSTLLRMLAGATSPDAGTLSMPRGVRVGYLEQTPRFEPGATVWQSVHGTPDPETDWEAGDRARETLAKLSLNQGGIGPDSIVDALSGGWKKRVAIARELVRDPDVLLLDEPTNHLDVESIVWLEDLLESSRFATITITHDRLFLQRVANRIVELDRRHPQGILNVKGDYATFLDQKAERLAAQEAREDSLRNRLRRETEWLRRGAKARTTKQQARIQRAADLQRDVTDLGARNQTRTAKLEFLSHDRKPKRLIEAKGAGKGYGGRPLFQNVDLLIGPESRIGLLGANGCGKSTLLRVLLGTEKPDTGTVFLSDKVQVAYFEQNREALDPRLTVQKTLCPGGDNVVYRGAAVHIRAYLDRFLFSAEQIDMQVGKLSGGEQSRLLLAKLMLREANVLVLDEPTNDLDIATLDVLEDCLREFDGAVLLVTHDRYFLDQVATEILAFPAAGDSDRRVLSFAGLAQWESWRDERAAARAAGPKTAAPAPIAAAPKAKRKLSYHEQRELQGIEARILEAETALSQATAESGLAENISHASRLTDIYRRIAEHQAEVERLYARWAELEALRDGSS